ncbi:homoisocitrate dehydrogenase [Methanobrevibacter millerae]|uniref:Isohomocitrate dehydrogenase AksF n=1 Tax=Methanobrevibacter millerae TaxID=230361 RepID=A0A0U3CF32_9EURY|nr:homoisocitrate dehydrogenase [Methanobrevibacter millerae]ALT68443.1 isohomocitrate dehydrogenase AksF [Methanobrevibacter millerae]MBO6109984.1 NAD-dependent isocitrate dehydrogenase [Methanobrevibacter sp.]
MYDIAIISGDGIGKEVMESAEFLLDKLDLNFNFKYGEAGFECFNKNGTTLPEETVKIAKSCDATLFGASTSTPGQPSPIINLRKKLNAYANLRPIKSYKGVKSIKDNIDFIIVRENTEGLYSQIEYGDDSQVIAERVITRKASEKISDIAFKLAKRRNKQKKVTCVHKSNVLKKTDGVFKESFYNIAKKYPEVKTEDFYVDATAMYLITNPQNFDVIVSTNLFGDILSDESAGLVGGLGLAPSGNLGDENALFEPVHGSAPDIAGKGIANPCSMILSTAMMLDYLGEKETALKINKAVENIVAKGKVLTPDLGGKAKTIEMTEAILKEVI